MLFYLIKLWHPASPFQLLRKWVLYMSLWRKDRPLGIWPNECKQCTKVCIILKLKHLHEQKITLLDNEKSSELDQRRILNDFRMDVATDIYCYNNLTSVELIRSLYVRQQSIPIFIASMNNRETLNTIYFFKRMKERFAWGWGWY